MPRTVLGIANSRSPFHPFGALGSHHLLVGALAQHVPDVSQLALSWDLQVYKRGSSKKKKKKKEKKNKENNKAFSMHHFIMATGPRRSIIFSIAPSCATDSSWSFRNWHNADMSSYRAYQNTYQFHTSSLSGRPPTLLTFRFENTCGLRTPVRLVCTVSIRHTPVCPY